MQTAPAPTPEPTADAAAPGGLRRLLRPRWIIGTLVVVLLVVLMVSLGFWQLSRLDERQATNARITERGNPPAQAFTDLVQVDGTDPDEVVYSLVTATGTYLDDEEILIRNRTRDGLPGWHVATPLRLEDGTVVVVNRGWVPFRLEGIDYSPPGGEVSVTGLVYESQSRSRFGATDAEGRELRDMARIDLDRIAAQLDDPLHPIYIQLETQTPQVEEWPLPLDRPATDEGPHLSYAIQWFTFSALAVLGWGLLIRRELRRDPTRPRPGVAPDLPDPPEPTYPPDPPLSDEGEHR